MWDRTFEYASYGMGALLLAIAIPVFAPFAVLGWVAKRLGFTWR